MRQVSGVRNPVPSVGMPLSGGSSHNQQHPSAPLSPPRGPASPSSPQQTPGTMYRKATSSLTSLAANALYPPGFSIAREGGSDIQSPQQMTSRSSGGNGGGAAGVGCATGPPARGSCGPGGEKLQSRTSGTLDPTPLGSRRSHNMSDATTMAEVVTDSRGDVLHRMCNVILLSHLSEREQQLKVRGQVIGTYFDQPDTGPSLDHPGEVQVMVTYVEACERAVPLLYPTKYAQTFGETETPDGNVIKWKAALCKVGKKFA